MLGLLIADGNLETCNRMTRLFSRSGYRVTVTASAEKAIGAVLRQSVQVVLLGRECGEMSAVRLIPVLKRCRPDLGIILLSDDLPLPVLRQARKAGIFYHALRPSKPGDEKEIKEAVRCAFDHWRHGQSLREAGTVSSADWRKAVHPNQGGSYESESHFQWNDDCPFERSDSSFGRRSGAGGSQRYRRLDFSRLLRPDRGRATGARGAYDDRRDQSRRRAAGRSCRAGERVTWKPILSLAMMEVKMAKWIILGGALLLALGMGVLFRFFPAAFDGGSGLMIWFFLGYCGIIVVAQVFAAARALYALARRHAQAGRLQEEQALERGKQ